MLGILLSPSDVDDLTAVIAAGEESERSAIADLQLPVIEVNAAFARARDKVDWTATATPMFSGPDSTTMSTADEPLARASTLLRRPQE